MLVLRAPPRGYGRDRRSGLLLPEDLRLARVPLVAGAGVDNPAAAASARNLYLPNNFDVYGFFGWLATESLTTTTDTTITSPINLNAHGWRASTGSGTITYRQANPVAGRPACLRLTTGAASGNNAVAWGILPLTTTDRTVALAAANPLPGGYTKLVLEAFVVPSALTAVDLFVGFAANNGDPVGTIHAVGALFQASVDATNWLAYANNGGTGTKTSTAQAASATAVNRIKVEWSNASAVVTVNGVATSISATFPTQALLPEVSVFTRGAAARDLNAEFAIDRFE